MRANVKPEISHFNWYIIYLEVEFNWMEFWKDKEHLVNDFDQFEWASKIEILSQSKFYSYFQVEMLLDLENVRELHWQFLQICHN